MLKIVKLIILRLYFKNCGKDIGRLLNLFYFVLERYSIARFDYGSSGLNKNRTILGWNPLMKMSTLEEILSEYAKRQNEIASLGTAI